MIANGDSAEAIATALGISIYVVSHVRRGNAHREILELANAISEAHAERVIRIAQRDAAGMYGELRKIARNDSKGIPPEVQRAAIVDTLNLALSRSTTGEQTGGGGGLGPTDLASFVKALITDDSVDPEQDEPGSGPQADTPGAPPPAENPVG